VDILYLLIPLSALLVLAIIAIFGWALHRGQFEELEQEGVRILQHDQDQDQDHALDAGAGLDADQGWRQPRPEQSPTNPTRPI
jgi:cbb3-type cytochrome oxidase maturation protein